MYDPLTRPSVRHHVDKFFNTISDSTIYKIKIPTDIIYGLLEQDPIITFSNYINFAQNNNFKDLNSDIRKYNIEGWNNQDNYSHSLQKLCKILWLLKDINSSKEVATPFQFIKTKYGYMVHPGTAKVIVSSYLSPIEYHEGFYVHSPQIDPTGILLDYATGQIDTTEEFISQFNFQKFFFKFRTMNITPRKKLNNQSVIPEKFYKWQQDIKNLNYNVLTYYDNYDPKLDPIRYGNRFNFDLNDEIKFVNEDTCLFHNVTLNKINNVWYKS
jgi:hypothetical protein